MARKRRIPLSESLKARVLVGNLHICCICRAPNLHVQIHHIDGNPANNTASNLAVLCLNCHSRASGDEGFGQRFSGLEVLEYKRQWEAVCRSERNAQRATQKGADRLLKGHGSAGDILRRESFDYLAVNSHLAQGVAASVGLNVDGPFGPFLFSRLKEKLGEAGRLSTERPASIEEAQLGHIVFENTLVTKVIFPSATLKCATPGVKELAVWTSDPDPRVIASPRESRYDFRGTFLYLITPIYDEADVGTFYSGCSALQAIANLVCGRSFLATDWDEPLGRRLFSHPIDKMKMIGGIVVDRRKVETMYKSRYMSDEQCANDGTRAFRAHDLLAYPLYIGNSF